MVIGRADSQTYLRGRFGVEARGTGTAGEPIGWSHYEDMQHRFILPGDGPHSGAQPGERAMGSPAKARSARVQRPDLQRRIVAPVIESVGLLVAGAFLGALFSYLFATLTRKSERGFVLGQESRAREAQAVEAIDEVLAAEELRLVASIISTTLGDMILPTFQQLHSVWTRYLPRLRDDLLTERLQSVYVLSLFLSGLMGEIPLSRHEGLFLMRTMIGEGRSAAAAFIHHEFIAPNELELDQLGALFGDGHAPQRLAALAKRLLAEEVDRLSGE